MNDEEERRAAILAARRKHQLAGKKASATKENRKSCRKSLAVISPTHASPQVHVVCNIRGDYRAKCSMTDFAGGSRGRAFYGSRGNVR